MSATVLYMSMSLDGFVARPATTQAEQAAGDKNDRGLGHMELERARVIEGDAGVTHVHYRVSAEVRHGS